jgi:hypothetical protein
MPERPPRLDPDLVREFVVAATPISPAPASCSISTRRCSTPPGIGAKA